MQLDKCYIQHSAMPPALLFDERPSIRMVVLWSLVAQVAGNQDAALEKARAMWTDPTADITSRVTALMGQMTLEVGTRSNGCDHHCKQNGSSMSRWKPAIHRTSRGVAPVFV